MESGIKPVRQPLKKSARAAVHQKNHCSTSKLSDDSVLF